MSDFQISLLPSARRYLKSLKKNQSLLRKYKLMMEELKRDPYKGKENKGDLAGVFTIDFRHNKTTYELAYYIEQKQDGQFIFIILGGTRENFYKELKRYLKSL